MNRRVIFVPDDYWTNPPKENPMTNLVATDCRRATALVVHYGNRNHDGTNAVLKEASDDERVTEMILSILGLFNSVIPQLHTDLGMACLSDTVLTLAKDAADTDCRRASRLVAHYGNDNVDGINTVLAEACDDNAVTPLILGLLHLYYTVTPVVFTPVGMSALQQSVLDFAAREETT